MGCSKQCFDKDDEYYEYEDCKTCPGRDDGRLIKKEQASPCSLHDMVMCFDDFFRIYHVTEKDKAELMCRLTEIYDRQDKKITQLTKEIENIWSDINAAVHSTYVDKDLLLKTLKWSKAVIEDAHNTSQAINYEMAARSPTSGNG